MSALTKPTSPTPSTVRVLTSRYWACWRGEPATLLLLLAQAPIIGWLCRIVWKSVETDTPTLYFVLSLSAIWFGCINACREIVKERAILERERMFGLSMGAVVASKLQVLGVLGLVQVVLLQGTVEWTLQLRGPLGIQILALWGASLSGTALGLLVSALAKRQEQAVAMVPLLLLPQILFSEFAVPSSSWGDVVRWVERFMPAGWAYEIFKQTAAADTDHWKIAGGFAALVGETLVLSLGTWLALQRRRDVVP